MAIHERRKAAPENCDGQATPEFALHSTGQCWWLYRKDKGQWVKVDTTKNPAMRPGDLLQVIVENLDLEKFSVQVLKS